MDKTLINKYITNLNQEIESINSDIIRLKVELSEFESKKQSKIDLKDSLDKMLVENDNLSAEISKLKPIK